MIEHALAFFLGCILLILWGVGTMFLGYVTTGKDHWRYSMVGWFMIGTVIQAILIGCIIVAYITGWAILKGISLL